MQPGSQLTLTLHKSKTPISYLVVPRFLASIVIIPLLCSVFIFAGVIGSFFAGIAMFDIDQGLFVEKIARFVTPNDIWRGMIKSLVFSAIMGAMTCSHGLKASGGAKGVGRATTNAVVMTLLVILFVDVIITYIQISF